MKIRVLGCYGGMDGGHGLTSFLINDWLAIDAGAITDALSFEEQKKITDVIITHSHLDHTTSLPFLVDNIFGTKHKPLNIFGHTDVLNDLRKHVFNDVSWPDFTCLPSPDNPVMKFNELPVGKETRIGQLLVKPVWVNHLVPTTGLIITENERSWINSSDTADTEEIWEHVNLLTDPRLLFLECSYPNRFAELAEASKHLTPAGVGRQLARLERKFPIRIYHGKPKHAEEIMKELQELGHPDLELLQQGKIYTL
ncbi:MAG TPA: 3',5'-cyclic-nucleotide phosphodiesterase [Acidobacteriota bacterium]|nr:3',5'-cyclic-nucleotide phosphodiesterase [Acidobacteriota bacterium]